MTIFAPRRYELAAGQLLGREGFAVREIDTGLVARSFNNRIPAYAWWLHTTCVFKEFEDDAECPAVVERRIVLHDDTVREKLATDLWLVCDAHADDIRLAVLLGEIEMTITADEPVGGA